MNKIYLFGEEEQINLDIRIDLEVFLTKDLVCLFFCSGGMGFPTSEGNR